MVSMLPVQPSRSAMKARHNSIASTAASSANLLCETFEHFFLRVLRNSNWSVVSESAPSPLSQEMRGQIGTCPGFYGGSRRGHQWRVDAWRVFIRHPLRGGAPRFAVFETWDSRS